MTTTVFITGSTGYIAAQIVKLLIKKGYNVIGSVRSVDKGEKLKTQIGSKLFNYEIVESIETEGSLDEPLKKHPEVTIFLHTASPVKIGADDPEKDLLIPAINGTKNVLRSIKKHSPLIEQVVVTSSLAAVQSADTQSDPNTVYDETSWNPVTYEEALTNPRRGYSGSKTFAEKAAWEFVEKENPGFSLTTVNPSFVFGPQAFDDQAKGTLNFSAEIVGCLLKLKPNDEIPQISGSFIDVRDVAQAHVSAFENENARGTRLVLQNGKFSSQTVLDIIRKNFPQLASRIAVGNPGSGDNLFKNSCKINNSKTNQSLGFTQIDLEKSVIDTIQQYLDNEEK